MKLLVTGGAGYLGSTLVPLLLERGHEVRILDNLMYGGGWLLPLFRNPRFEFVKGDILDPQAVMHAVDGRDATVHLAAIVGFPACRKYSELAERVNVDGTKLLAAALGRKRPVVFASTGSNYGALENDICTEETPLNPVSLYGRTKTAAERYLLENCTTIAYRFATAFGVSPRMRLDLLINDFVYTALRLRYLVIYEPHFMRSFIHVYDIARAILFALENHDRMAGQVYNVGSETMNLTKGEVCEIIKRHIDYYLHIASVGEDADKRNYVVSYEKIRSAGYQTTIGIEEGIEEIRRGLEVLDVKNQYANV